MPIYIYIYIALVIFLFCYCNIVYYYAYHQQVAIILQIGPDWAYFYLKTIEFVLLLNLFIYSFWN